MASPSFPYPNTAPAYDIFAAPAYAPYTFSSSAAYHHPFPIVTAPASFPSPIPTQFNPNRPPPAATPIHGDLDNSPSPYMYGAPSTYPYAAAFPATASSSSPILPNWPPPAPDPTPSTAAIHPTSAAQLSVLHDHGSWSPTHHTSFNHPPIQAASQPDTAPTTPHREHHPPQSHTSSTPRDGNSTTVPDGRVYQSEKSGSNGHPWVASTPSPTLDPRPRAQQNADHSSTKAASDNHGSMGSFSPASEFKASLKPRKALTANCSATYASCDPLSREFRKIHTRLEQQQTCDRASFDTIQGEVSRLLEAVSLLVISIGLPENPRSSARPEHDTHSGLAATTKQPTTTVSLSINEQYPANKSCLLSTPPPPSSNLSPIAEVNTTAPGRAAIAGNTQHPQGQPIQFRNLHVPTTMQDASSVFTEMPQSYGYHNLNRKSIIRADGTEHSYFSLPEDYSLEPATPPMSLSAVKIVGVTAQPSIAAQGAGLPPVPCSKANQHAGYESLPAHDVQPPTAAQDDHSGFKDMPEYDVYEDATAFGSCRHTTVINQKRPDNELIFMCVNKALDNAFSEDVTDVTSTHVPYVFVQVSAKGGVRYSKTKFPSLPDSELCGKQRKPQQGNNQQRNLLLTEMGREVWDPGASLPLLSCKTQHYGQALQPATHATTLAGSRVTRFTGCKFLPFRVQNNICVFWESKNGETTYFYWDPGILKIRDTILDKCVVPHQVQFVQDTFELSLLISEAVIQYYAPNGVNSVPHGISFTLQRATHFSQGSYLCSLYCKSVLKTEYCWMRCLWKFSIKLATRLQWDPGVPKILHSYTATHPIEINAMTVLVLALPCSTCTFVVAKIHLNGSELRAGQLTYMPQGTSINSSEWVRHMVTVLSFWSPSFEMAKLQWDPGIGISSSMYLWLQGLTARIATVKPFSGLQISELALWQRQVTTDQCFLCVGSWYCVTSVQVHLVVTVDRKKGKCDPLLPDFSEMHCNEFTISLSWNSSLDDQFSSSLTWMKVSVETCLSITEQWSQGGRNVRE